MSVWLGLVLWALGLALGARWGYSWARADQRIDTALAWMDWTHERD